MIQKEKEVTSYKLACVIARVLDEKLGKDITILNISNVSSFADYFVICSAPTATQVRAIADNIEEELEEQENIKFGHKEGYHEGEWILLDYGDVVAHIFKTENREYYALEKLWGDAEIVKYEG